jgi:nitroreductase
MEFEQLIRMRWSVRAYKRDPIPDEVFAKVLEAARLAPTAANRQAFRILVIPTPGREQDLKRIYARPWFTQAPVVIAVCALTDRCWVRADGKSYCDVDAAIVMDHLILAAADLGLGSCWVGAFDAGAARQVLKLPESVEPIAFTPLGYSDERPVEKKRRPVEALVTYYGKDTSQPQSWS